MHRFDLIGLLRGVVAEHRQSRIRHELSIESSEAQLIGEWDQHRLVRVLSNLLDNAIKYSPDGGQIEIQVHRESEDAQEYVVLVVRDPGVGIPVEDLGQVFERFQRGSNVAGRIAGTGIGLASARSIVKSHGGTIGVQSRAGYGSETRVGARGRR